MPKSQIHYRSGYKYQLAKDFSMNTGIKPKADITTEFIDLDKSGQLTVKSGYAWDGPSGGVVDRDENLRASLVHDALYQLQRQRKLSTRTYRDKTDRLFQKMCREDGIPTKLAQFYYQGLKWFGRTAADPKNAKVIKVAP